MEAAHQPVRVAIANDYEIVVAGLEAMLRPFEQRVAVRAAITIGEPIGEPVAVALYDTFGRADQGLLGIKQLLADQHVERVALFTGSPRPSLCSAALEAGASAVLSKARSALALVEGLERVAAGEELVDDAGGNPSTAFPGASRGLSPRQAEVVALLLQGLSNAEIAEALYVDVNTVKTHLRHAYRSLGVHTRAQALAMLLGDADAFRRRAT